MKNDKRLHHSRTEWTFPDILTTKQRFRCRVAKVTSISYRKTRDFFRPETEYKTAIPLQSGEVDIHLARRLRPTAVYKKYRFRAVHKNLRVKFSLNRTNRAFGCRVAASFTKIAITLEQNALFELFRTIWVKMGSNWGQNGVKSERSVREW